MHSLITGSTLREQLTPSVDCQALHAIPEIQKYVHGTRDMEETLDGVRLLMAAQLGKVLIIEVILDVVLNAKSQTSF